MSSQRKTYQKRYDHKKSVIKTNSTKLLTSFSSLQQQLGYTFFNLQNLTQALTIADYANRINSQALSVKYTSSLNDDAISNLLGKKFVKCNEMFEFLGDRLYNLAVALDIFSRYNYIVYNRISSNLNDRDVQKELLETMASFGKIWKRNVYSFAQERKNPIKQKSDLLEALCGAIFVDSLQDHKRNPNREFAYALDNVFKFLMSKNGLNLYDIVNNKAYKTILDIYGSKENMPYDLLIQNSRYKNVNIDQNVDKDQIPILVELENLIGKKFNHLSVLQQAFIPKNFINNILHNYKHYNSQALFDDVDVKIYDKMVIEGDAVVKDQNDLFYIGDRAFQFVCADYIWQNTNDYGKAGKVFNFLNNNYIKRFLLENVHEGRDYLIDKMKEISQIISPETVFDFNKTFGALCGAIFIDSNGDIGDVGRFFFEKTMFKSFADYLLSLKSVPDDFSEKKCAEIVKSAFGNNQGIVIPPVTTIVKKP